MSGLVVEWQGGRVCSMKCGVQAEYLSMICIWTWCLCYVDRFWKKSYRVSFIFVNIYIYKKKWIECTFYCAVITIYRLQTHDFPTRRCTRTNKSNILQPQNRYRAVAFLSQGVVISVNECVQVKKCPLMWWNMHQLNKYGVKVVAEVAHCALLPNNSFQSPPQTEFCSISTI